MAKKKQIVINFEELTPTTLEIVKDKKKVSIFGLVWIFVIFAIFIVGVIYLPDIAGYINNYFNPSEVTPSNSSNNKKNDDSSEEEKVIKEYVIEENPQVSIDNFKISNIKIDEGKFVFDVINESDEILDFSKYNYFINLYDQNRKLLGRIMLRDIIVSPRGSITSSNVLTDINVYMFTVIDINVDDYPAVDVNNDSNNMATFTCNKDYETINYLLNNNKVYAINIMYEVLLTDNNFNSLYGTYQAMYNSFSTLSGVSSSFENGENSLVFRTLINLNALGEEKINLKSFYPKDTDVRVINFELTSMGYKCS